LIRDNRVDFVGIQETKKEDFSCSFLKNMSCLAVFGWPFLPAKGIAGDILVGIREDNFAIVSVSVSVLNYYVSCMLQSKNGVYESPYDEGEILFIDELHLILSNWQGLTFVGMILI
jgi:hypothetical protein